MAKGKPSSWARMDFDQAMWLTKSGVSITVWKKGAAKHKGKLVISVGGLKWYPYNKKGKPAWSASWQQIYGDE